MLASLLAGCGFINVASGQERAQGAAPSPLAVIVSESTAGARFFTLNEVLARRGVASQGPATATRLASLDTAKLRGSLSDALPAAFRVGPKLGPFGVASFQAPEGLLWVKWRKLAAELVQDEEAIDQCRAAPARCTSEAARRIALIIESVRARTGIARVEEANRSVNSAIRYVSDLVQHGVPDLWSGALTTFSSGQGDCEDYAIAKYVILRAAGIAAEDLRIMLVRDLVAREAHAVLAANVSGKWLVLDNRRAEIREDREIGYFVPLFALDDHGVSLLARAYEAAAPGAGLQQVTESGRRGLEGMIRTRVPPAGR